MVLLNHLFQNSQPKQLEIPGFSVSFLPFLSGKHKHGGEVKGRACWGSERHSTSKTTVALTVNFAQFCLLPVLSVKETERGEVPLLFSGRKHICGTVTETEKRNLSGTLKYRYPSFPKHAHTPTSLHLQTISLLEITLQRLLWLHQGTRSQTVEYNELFLSHNS